MNLLSLVWLHYIANVSVCRCSCVVEWTGDTVGAVRRAEGIRQQSGGVRGPRSSHGTRWNLRHKHSGNGASDSNNQHPGNNASICNCGRFTARIFIYHLSFISVITSTGAVNPRCKQVPVNNLSRVHVSTLLAQTDNGWIVDLLWTTLRQSYLKTILNLIVLYYLIDHLASISPYSKAIDRVQELNQEGRMIEIIADCSSHKCPRFKSWCVMKLRVGS